MQRKGEKEEENSSNLSLSNGKVWGENSAESVFQSGDSAVLSGKKKGLKLLVKKELKLTNLRTNLFLSKKLMQTKR